MGLLPRSGLGFFVQGFRVAASGGVLPTSGLHVVGAHARFGSKAHPNKNSRLEKHLTK